MIITVDVRINNEPGDSQSGGYGSLAFSESATFSGAGFETVSKVFTRCHDLLQTLKHEHSISTDALKRK